MDIVGPLPVVAAQKKFLLFATDYFSKWVEAKVYASIKDKDVMKFVWKNNIFRFGIPQVIVADNGPQFDSIAFRNFCSELKIQNLYSTPWYPQSNGQAEANEQDLTVNIKEKTRASQRKVGGGAVRRLVGLPNDARMTNRNTHFALAYRIDAIIPTEIGLPTTWTAVQGQRDEDQELGRNLDWAYEVRESASIWMAAYQQRATAHYNRKAQPLVFKVGTLVLRRVFKNTTEKRVGKFQAN